MFSLSRAEWLFLAAILVYSCVPLLGGLLRIADLAVGLSILPSNSRAVDSPVPVVLHVLGSLVFCLGGALQFLPSMRRRNIALHRRLGKGVAVAGLISAGTGLWMTLLFQFPIDLQGGLLFWGRIIVSTAMAAFIIMAVVEVWSGKLHAHRSHMLRAYAIAQGASTQALLGIGWILLFRSELSGPMRDVVMLSGWCLNLLVVELLIMRLKTRTPTKQLRQLGDV